MIECKCDNCGNDLSKDRGADDYRILVKNEQLPCGTSSRMDIYIKPDLETELHFCGVECLKKYFNKEK